MAPESWAAQLFQVCCFPFPRRDFMCLMLPGGAGYEPWSHVTFLCLIVVGKDLKDHQVQLFPPALPGLPLTRVPRHHLHTQRCVWPLLGLPFLCSFSCSPTELDGPWSISNLLRYKRWAAKLCQALVWIYLCLHWTLQLIAKRWQDGNCIMKNIPSTFLGFLCVTMPCTVATQCSSLEKVEKSGYGSVALLCEPKSIIFPKPLNVQRKQGGCHRPGIL